MFEPVEMSHDQVLTWLKSLSRQYDSKMSATLFWLVSVQGDWTCVLLWVVTLSHVISRGTSSMSGMARNLRGWEHSQIDRSVLNLSGTNGGCPS